MTTESSDTSYFRISVRGLNRQNEDGFTSFCFSRGAQGVAEDLAFSQPEIIYNAQVVETRRFDVNVFFGSDPGQEFLGDLKREFPEIEASVHVEPQQDWMENWKKGFEPFCFVDPFWVVPSWSKPPAEAKEVLLVDPGMAFGTGTHETTRLAGRLIVENWSRVSETADGVASVLDVGTGTGILALITQKLGAVRVVAIDNDPEARRVSRENLLLNNADVEVPELQLDEIEEKFDLVIANIIDGVLLNLKEDLLKRLNPGGTLILSGILTEREGPFLDDFLRSATIGGVPTGAAIRNRKRVTMGEWTAFVLR